MWKEKENDSMDEGAQEDEQYEMETENEETGRNAGTNLENNGHSSYKCGSLVEPPKASLAKQLNMHVSICMYLFIHMYVFIYTHICVHV